MGQGSLVGVAEILPGDVRRRLVLNETTTEAQIGVPELVAPFEDLQGSLVDLNKVFVKKHRIYRLKKKKRTYSTGLLPMSLGLLLVVDVALPAAQGGRIFEDILLVRQITVFLKFFLLKSR